MGKPVEPYAYNPNVGEYEIKYPVTRNAPKSVFSRFVLFPGHDVFVLSQFDQELLAESDGRKIGRRIAQIPGQGGPYLSPHCALICVY